MLVAIILRAEPLLKLHPKSAFMGKVEHHARWTSVERRPTQSQLRGSSRGRM